MNLATVLSVVLMLSAVGYLLLGIRMLTTKRHASNLPISLLILLIAVWVMGGAVELIAPTLSIFSIGRTGHFIGTAFAPVAAYIAFREYADKVTPTGMIVMLLIIPVVSVTLAATNSYHEFMWVQPVTNSESQFLARPEHWGPWFLYVHAPYSYSILGVALVTLLTHSAAIATPHRRGLFVLLGVCAVPIAAMLSYDIGIGPDTISYVPIVFAILLPLYAWLAVSSKIAQFTPLAYETVFQNMQDPVVVIDDDQRIIGLNHRALDFLDMKEGDALRTPLEAAFGSGSTCVFEAIDTGKPQKMMTNTGRFLHVQVSSINPRGASGRGGRVLMFRDVSDVERAQTEVRKSERLLRTLIDHSVNGILRLRWINDEEYGKKVLRCIFANSAAGRFLAVEPDDLIDCAAAHIVRLAANAMDAEDIGLALDRFREAVNTNTGIDIDLHHESNGENRWLRLICEPVGEDFAATFVDVTDGKARERHMESIAWSDPLTGVLNRRGFERDASKRLSESNDKATGALLFIDLNGFKQINDQFGHEVGDELLRIAAERLRKSLRSCDIIGRPGGDEFVALVPDVTSKVAEDLASRLANGLEEAYAIGEETLKCAASIGLALYPENANTLTGLLREADQAMYRAKARARDVPNLRATGLLEKAM